MIETRISSASALAHASHCPEPDLFERRARSGDLLVACRGCGERAIVDEQLAPDPGGRFTLACVRCPVVMRLHRPKPRIPLCPTCSRGPRRPKGGTNGAAQ